MAVHQRIGLVAVWVFSLTVVALLTQAHAQVAPSFTQIVPVTPTVFAGNDIGFRVKGTRGETPVGALVVRINGTWTEVAFGSPQPFQLR